MKAPKPKPTSYDRLLEQWDTDRQGATLRRRVQQELEAKYDARIDAGRTRFRTRMTNWRNVRIH